MNKFLAGITLMSVACSTHYAVAAQRVGALGAMTKGLGHFRVYLSVSGVYSQRKVTLRSTMTTRFKAGYLYAPAGERTLERRWSDAAVNAAGNREVCGLAGVLPTGLNAVLSGVPANFCFSGVAPEEWLVADGAGAWANDDAASATQSVVEKALFYRLGNAAEPTDKAWVESKEREAQGSAESQVEYKVCGIRAEVGLGYRVLQNLTVFLAASYKFDADNKKETNVAKDIAFETKGMHEAFRAVNGGTLSANLLESSFAYNEGRLAQGIKATVNVTESFGCMLGLDWTPCPMFGLCLKAGLRRYDLEVVYEDGRVAYPGTMGMFVDGFTQENGEYRLLTTQKDTKRVLKGVAWPFAVAASMSLIVAKIHRFTLGMDYALFDAMLTAAGDDEKKQKSDEKGHAMTMVNPYDVPPTHAQMDDSTGIHQFSASEATNTLTAKLEVQELGFFGGYSIAL